MTYENTTPLYEYWNDAYIGAARVAYPAVTRKHDLAVGWKLTRKDGTAYRGYCWPLVNGDHDLPVLHKATNWNPHNKDGCPSRPGDGLCLVPQGQPVRAAGSGGMLLMEGIGHVLVYPTDLVRGGFDKKRSPWVIDVDCFDLGELIRGGGVRDWLRGATLCYANLVNANLVNANLSYANLSYADLSYATLVNADLGHAKLRRADLGGANLRRADLGHANLSNSNLCGANLVNANLANANFRYVDLRYANLRGARGGKTAIWPPEFDWAKAGVLA